MHYHFPEQNPDFLFEPQGVEESLLRSPEKASARPRTLALAEGILVDVSEVAQEAGFLLPMAVSAGLWADLADVSTESLSSGSSVEQCGGENRTDISPRLRYVLERGHQAVLDARRDGSGRADESQFLFTVVLLEADKNENLGVLYRLRLTIGPDDAGKPVLTLLQADQD